MLVVRVVVVSRGYRGQCWIVVVRPTSGPLRIVAELPFRQPLTWLGCATAAVRVVRVF